MGITFFDCGSQLKEKGRNSASLFKLATMNPPLLTHFYKKELFLQNGMIGPSFSFNQQGNNWKSHRSQECRHNPDQSQHNQPLLLGRKIYMFLEILMNNLPSVRWIAKTHHQTLPIDRLLSSKQSRLFLAYVRNQTPLVVVSGVSLLVQNNLK